MSDIAAPAQPEKNPASPAKLRKADRELIAVTLRKQGGSYRQIADQVKKQPGAPPKYSASMAYRDCMAGLRKLNKAIAEGAEENRRLDLERLDELFAAYWMNAKKGDYAAFDRVMQIIEKRAKLYGYEAVNKLELSGKLAHEVSGPGGAAVPLDVVQLDSIIARVYGPLLGLEAAPEPGTGAPATDREGDDEGLEDD